METNGNGVVNPEARGNDGETVTSETKDQLSYESYQRLLSQRKKDREKLEKYQSELNELKSWKQSLEEQEATKKGEYEKILANYKEENSKLKNELTEYQKSLVDGMKLQAFLDKLPGSLDSQDYYQFANLEEIAIDPESGAVDQQTLQSAVDNFVKKHSRLLTPKNNRSLPGHDRVGPLSYKPKSVKEMTREELKEAFIKGQL